LRVGWRLISMGNKFYNNLLTLLIISPMSNSKRSSYFYSPLKVESDQKDIIIAHLQE
jgi:hypothetical protein